MTTKTKTVADELRDAAKTLRETAVKATRGPWIAHPTMGFSGEDTSTWTVGLPYCEKGGPEACEPDCAGDVVTTGREGCEEDFLSEADAQWIALVSPVVAEPLAAWLSNFAIWWDNTVVWGEDEALRHVTVECGDEAPECGCFDAALAVAKVINEGDPR